MDELIVIDEIVVALGAVQRTTADASAGFAETPVGADGRAGLVGVAVTIAEGTLVPTLFVADTRNEYAVPFVRPVTTSDSAVDAG